MAVRKRSHIYVELFYPTCRGRLAGSCPRWWDLVKIVFFGIGAWASIRIFRCMGRQSMTAVMLPMTWVYAPVLAGFMLMTLRRDPGRLAELAERLHPSAQRPEQPVAGRLRREHLMVGILLLAMFLLLVIGAPIAISLAGSSLLFVPDHRPCPIS